jgi:hypothetical protein
MVGWMRALIVAACLLAVAAPVALALPPGPPPKQGGGPPPAWLEKPGTDRWLAYSSYCWTTMCADFLPPDSRPDLPRIQLAPGTLVRFHLGLRPTSLRLARFGGGRTWRLARTRVSAWKVAARGIYVLDAHAAAGSASYVFRIV